MFRSSESQKKNQQIISQLFSKFDFGENNFDYLFCENRIHKWIDGITYKNPGDFFQKNYLKVQVKAFLYGLATLPEKSKGVNFTWLTKLHELTIKGLHHENGDDCIPMQVRNHPLILAFPSPIDQALLGSPNKASVAGLEELHDAFVNKINLFINDKTSFKKCDLNTAKDYYAKQQEEFKHKEELIDNLKNEFDIDTAANFVNGTYTCLLKNIDCINQFITHNFNYNGLLGYCLPNSNPIAIRTRAEELIRNYNNKINYLINIDDIILEIIILTKGLLNLHVWPDGNGRVCAHQLLNLLLIQNGISPAFLENNCLDAFTKEELLEEIKIGIKEFELTLDDDNDRNIMNELIKPTILERFILKNKTNDIKEYFSEKNKICITESELIMLAANQNVAIEMILSYFDHNKTIIIKGKKSQHASMNEFIALLLQSAIEQANKPLLLNLIKHCMQCAHKQKVLSEKLLDLVLYGDIDIFEKVKDIFLKKLSADSFKIKMYTTAFQSTDETVADVVFGFIRDDLDHFLTNNILGPCHAQEMFGLPTNFNLLKSMLELNYFRNIDENEKKCLVRIIKQNLFLSLDQSAVLLEKINQLAPQDKKLAAYF